jgi:hypothetical protein
MMDCVDREKCAKSKTTAVMQAKTNIILNFAEKLLFWI